MATASIDAYNDEVGRVYATRPDLFMLSPAFCRCEGQTQVFAQWASSEEPARKSLLVCLARFAGKIIRDIAFSMLAVSAKLECPPGRGVFVFSYFDLRNADGGKLREEYFRGLLDGNPDVRCFYKLVSPGLFRRGASYLRLLSSLKKGYFAYAEHSFISLWMIAKAVGLTWRHWTEFSAMSLPPDFDASLRTLLISTHRREICDGTVYSGYLQQLFFEKVLAHHPRLVLSVWENFPWERILEHVKKRVSPEAISRGFQHTGFSKKLLQHYPSRHERALDTYPDSILCNGEVNREELAKNPAITSKILIGGALRQDRLLRKGFTVPKALSSGRPFDIAFAFSWDQATYGRILEDLRLLPESMRIHLKFHPDFPDWMRRNDFPARFVNSRASWEEIGTICPLVLAHDNSLIFEGYYHGMHAVVYDGADPGGLGRRDFGSPIVHLERSDLPSILRPEIIGRINASAQEILKTRYLERYFVQHSEADLKRIFIGV